jgi:orotidine-5'-phosphate decarboxylase
VRVKPERRTFVALDTPEFDRARALARMLAGRVGGFKIGLEAFVAFGPPLIEELRALGHAIFLDLKFHDIPNTVAGASAAAARWGVGLFTVHALGGPAMIARAVAASRAAAPDGSDAPVVLAVTVLTSHDDASLRGVGIEGTCAEAVVRLAQLARDAGAGGVVCSPLEVAAARRAFPEGRIVVPGIRLAGAGQRSPDDQARVATPSAAVRAGADLLVVGRPITEAEDPAAAAAAIADDIDRNAGK